MKRWIVRVQWPESVQPANELGWKDEKAQRVSKDRRYILQRDEVSERFRSKNDRKSGSSQQLGLRNSEKEEDEKRQASIHKV